MNASILNSNSTSNSTNLSSEAQHISLAVLLCLFYLLGLVLNGFSLWVFTCRMAKWSTCTVLQFNLAISDAIASPATPLLAAYLARGSQWEFGRFACHLKITLLSAHFFVCYSRLATSVSCVNISSPQGRLIKMKSLRMIGICLIIFGLCLLPLNVVRTVMVVVKKYYPHRVSLLFQLETAYYASHILGGINCCLDPLIYFFGSSNFRKTFRTITGRHKGSTGKSQ